MLSSMKGIFMAITSSIFKYPSCLFWGASVPTMILFANSAIIYSKYNFTTIREIKPIVSMINNPQSSLQFKIVSVLSSIFVFGISHYINFYYPRSHKNSEPSVKAKLNVYIRFYQFFAIAYAITFNLTTFLNIFSPNSFESLQSILFLIMLFTMPFLHIIPRSIVRLKHPSRKLVGYGLITLQTLLTLLIAPFHLYSAITGVKNGFIFPVIYSLTMISYLLGALSFVFDATTLLGHRFIKFYQYLPKQKSSNPKRKVKLGV